MVSWPPGLTLVRYGAMQGTLRGVQQGVLASHKDLERLENATGWRSLHFQNMISW